MNVIHCGSVKNRCDSTCLTRKLFLKNLAGHAPQLYLGRTME